MLARPLRPWTALALAGLACAAALALHLPGHVPRDALWVWTDARMGVLSSPHPAVWALIWRVLEWAAPGPWLFTALQVGTLFAAGAALVARVRPGAWLAGGLFAWLLLWPPVFALQGQLQKDMLGGNLLLIAFALLAAPAGRTVVAAAFALAAVAALLRYQYGVGLVGLGLLLWWRHGRAAGRVLAAGVGTAALTGVALLTALPLLFTRSTDPGDIEAAFRKIAIFDIAGTVANRPAVPLPALEAVVDGAALRARILELYDPDRVDTLWVRDGVFALLAPVPDGVLRRAWWDAARAAPGAFLRHRWAAFMHLNAIGTPTTCWPVFAGVAVPPARDPPLTTALAGSVSRPVSYAVLRDRWFPANTLLFRPWPYAVWALLVLALFTRGRAPAAAAALAATALLNDLSFLALPQACDFRYSYLLVAASGFMAVLVAGAWTAKRT